MDTLELDALEVKLLDPLTRQSLEQVNYSWSITSLTGQHLQLQIDFENPALVSSDQADDLVEVTFWDTKYFKSIDGDEIAFGSRVQWRIIR